MAHPLEQQDFLNHALAHPKGDCTPCVWAQHGCRFELLDAGVLQINPEKEGCTEVGGSHDLVLSCGVHGNETAPIEIVNELVSQILSGALTVTQRVLFIIGNPLAINAGTRDVEENMNRMFGDWLSEDQQSHPERVRAAVLQKAMGDFFEGGNGRRIHFDLHTAIRGSKREKFAVHPYTGGKPYSRQFLQLLNAGEVDTVLLMHEPATTFSYFSHHYLQADSATLELGRVAPFGQNDMQRFAAIVSVCQRLIEGREPDYVPFDQLTLFAVTRAIHKQTEQFKLNFADDTFNFTTFSVGDEMASDGDIVHRAEIEGEAIIFPNAKVPIGQRTLLTVAPTVLGGSRLTD